MKKKNIVGHMVAEQEAPASRFRRLHLISKLVCLIIAVLIWLIVVNVTNSNNGELTPDPNVPLVEYAEE